MRILNTGVSAVAIVAFALAPAYAQGRGGSHPPHTTTTTTTHGPTTHGPTTHGPTTHGPSTHGPTTTTTTTTNTTTTTTISPIAQKIQSHPQLAARLTSMLPEGMSLNTAATGFRNQGQFIAALHVSQNLDIPFTELKTTMLGTTTTPGMSLGQAIHKLRPTADSSTATQTAVSQASSDLNGK